MKKFMLIASLFLLTGCGGLLNFPTLNAPKSPDTTYNYEETFEKNPTAVAVDGKIVVVENQKRTVTAGYVAKEKPLSWWQKFCNKLANLSIIVVIISVILLSLGITGPFLFLFKSYLKAKKTLKGVVDSIDKTKAVETSPVLKTTLSSTLDLESKKLIDDLKRS